MDGLSAAWTTSPLATPQVSRRSQTCAVQCMTNLRGPISRFVLNHTVPDPEPGGNDANEAAVEFPLFGGAPLAVTELSLQTRFSQWCVRIQHHHHTPLFVEKVMRDQR